MSSMPARQYHLPTAFTIDTDPIRAKALDAFRKRLLQATEKDGPTQWLDISRDLLTDTAFMKEVVSGHRVFYFDEYALEAMLLHFGVTKHTRQQPAAMVQDFLEFVSSKGYLCGSGRHPLLDLYSTRVADEHEHEFFFHVSDLDERERRRRIKDEARISHEQLHHYIDNRYDNDKYRNRVKQAFAGWKPASSRALFQTGPEAKEAYVRRMMAGRQPVLQVKDVMLWFASLMQARWSSYSSFVPRSLPTMVFQEYINHLTGRYTQTSVFAKQAPMRTCGKAVYRVVEQQQFTRRIEYTACIGYVPDTHNSTFGRGQCLAFRRN